MRTITITLAVLFLTTLPCFSQNQEKIICDCSSLIETKEDKVSGKTYTNTKDYLIISKDEGEKGFGINLMLTERGYVIFSIKAVGAGNCIDKGDEINILFTDGTRLKLASEGDFNCKGNATVYFGNVFGKKNQLNELKTKTINTMRVWTTDGYVEEEFEPIQANQFKNSLNCLTNK